MFARHILVALGLALSVAGCATMDTATRSAPIEVPGLAAVSPSFKVEAVRVTVPDSLSISEANRYYPIADIVWRGDAMGDRRKQVQDIFMESARRSISQLEGVQPVKVDIRVQRFHSLSEKARYTVGGDHNMHFTMTVLDAATDTVLVPERLIKANLDAFGGQRAIAEEARGNGQKVRVTAYLAEVLGAELSRPLVPTAF